MNPEDFDVLFVDDDINILKAMKRNFHEQFSIATASTIDEALNLLNDHQFPIVISDMKMPEMNGADLLIYVVTERINRKITFQDTNDLIELLECHDKIPKINSSVETCDLAVIILSRISGISAVQRDTEVKAIISHLKDKEVFRYHIIKMNESELKTFRKKIKSWASKKFPA